MKVGIVVAMEEELNPFLKNKRYVVEKWGIADAYRFETNGEKIVAVCPAHVGEICASSATQLLITQYRVDVVLNFGVVGALEKEISLLSAVLVDSVVHYDMDTSSIDACEVGRYGCFDEVAVPTDGKLLSIARELAPDLPVVRCASGDKFVESESQKSALAKKFGAQICDMESAGVLICATLNRVPVLIVKTVSDSLSGGGGEFWENVERASQKFADLVDKIIGRLSVCPTE